MIALICIRVHICGPRLNRKKTKKMTIKNEILPLHKYPVQVTEKLRYGDTDRQGHVNNAVFATLCESGRCAFLYDPDRPLATEQLQFVIAQLTINFLDEMNWPGTVIVGTGVSRIGRSSFGLVQSLFVDETCVALCDSVLVTMDVETRKSTPLTEDILQRLTALKVDTTEQTGS